jgi:hypothetical protein
LVPLGGDVHKGEQPKQERTFTSIKNATVDADRIARGMPPAMEPMRRSSPELWNAAMKVIDADPDVAEKVVAKIKADPNYAPSDVENMVLLHRKIDLENDFDKLSRERDFAADDMKKFPARKEDFDSLQNQVQQVQKYLKSHYDALKTAGTAQGRALQSRNVEADEDFTVESARRDSLETAGEDLTPEEVAGD